MLDKLQVFLSLFECAAVPVGTMRKRLTYVINVVTILCFLPDILQAVHLEYVERLKSKSTIRIGFGSCIQDPQNVDWSVIEKASVDLMILLGDNVYQGASDIGNEERIDKLYQRLFSNGSFKQLFKNIPVFAIWDDHDYGLDNSDSSAKGRRESLRIFRKYWRNPPTPPELDGGIPFKLDLGSVLLLMTDGRSFRVNDEQKGHSAMFGGQQIAWLVSEISNATASVIVLASGNQILSNRNDGESLTSYPSEQQPLLDALVKTPAKVVILSGDRHYAELLRIERNGKAIVEATSSPIQGQFRRAEEAGVDRDRIGLAVGQANFGILTLSSLHSDLPKISVQMLNWSGLGILGVSED